MKSNSKCGTILETLGGVMRKCSTCESRIPDKARTDRCDYCRKRERNLKDWKKLQVIIEEHQIRSRDEVNTPGGIAYRKKHGIPLDAPRKKNKNGDGCIDYSGYKTISVKGHPNAMDSKGRIREHVYVMSNIIGRALHKGETVHHINHNKLDNRPENLELWSRSQPNGSRVEDKIKWALEFLSQYGEVSFKEILISCSNKIFNDTLGNI